LSISEIELCVDVDVVNFRRTHIENDVHFIGNDQIVHPWEEHYSASRGLESYKTIAIEKYIKIKLNEC
jgi:hypothetical protein